MNHLQVVFGLIDMGETGDAREYIERVYGDIQRVGQALKTAIPAVNALLAAKLSECRARGIDARLETASPGARCPRRTGRSAAYWATWWTTHWTR
jgi:sensor histidine kinase regulating citrate/malate metabolism